MPNFHISVDYKECDSLDKVTIEQCSYKGVTVTQTSPGHKIVKRFNSGDIVKDWADTMTWCAEQIGPRKIECCMMSSSCDHFVMDVSGYGWTKDEMIVTEDMAWNAQTGERK